MITNLITTVVTPEPKIAILLLHALCISMEQINGKMAPEATPSPYSPCPLALQHLQKLSVVVWLQQQTWPHGL